MKLLTFRPARARTGHFGVLLADNRVLDVSALAGRKLPATLLECIRKGDSALAAVKTAAADAEAALARGEQLPQVFALDAVTLEAPLIPGKIMAVGKNYADHAAEGSGQTYSRVAGFVKVSSCVVPSGATVRKPEWTETFDYENELAIVIGRDCSDVAPEAAYDCVFGYTIMNDLSCREVQQAERKEGNICIGKNFPTAAPLGPWIVTKDEIPDPHNLRLVTRVNGEVRQNGNTANQIYRIPAQIAWYSHAGFEPGDLISSGTPAGTAIGYKGPGTWYLQHGDRVECEIEGIGVLANTVTTRKRRS
ncbi:MAG: fumarylacetoacetate hydrolase family protein [Betaproteobacteria bacterium]|nr:fumarylacetoacetate hydrolase family protein [Betaproteobacteria bacterium]MBI2226845.1 fumarylacetoacetate hydrolase family protein [Betaproteobacteria bacterium]MBI2291669.1 fumarylacetoacetate hydrolase family protein [Betaproteobacteria bacterium]MBI3052617.1 fumarylacetoacetate hydrolase family protein [Betaproteobacteria bacterium]